MKRINLKDRVMKTTDGLNHDWEDSELFIENLYYFINRFGLDGEEKLIAMHMQRINQLIKSVSTPFEKIQVLQLIREIPYRIYKMTFQNKLKNKVDKNVFRALCFVDRMLNSIDNLIESIEKTKNNSPLCGKAFNLSISDEKKKILFSELRWILFHDDTSEESFIKIFSNKTIDAPIIVKSTQLLAYFLFKLNDKKLIPNQWQTTAENGKMFKSKKEKDILKGDLSGAVRNFERGLPANKNKVDEALSKIK